MGGNAMTKCTIVHTLFQYPHYGKCLTKFQIRHIVQSYMLAVSLYQILPTVILITVSSDYIVVIIESISLIGAGRRGHVTF